MCSLKETLYSIASTYLIKYNLEALSLTQPFYVKSALGLVIINLITHM